MSDWTSSQADSAGKRLRDGRATEADEAFFRQFLAAHGRALRITLEGLRRIRFPDGSEVTPTARVKTRETLMEKLRRGTRLSQVRDIAGARVVVNGTQLDQDGMAVFVGQMFAGDAEVVDRRTVPNHGYRAVHVIGRVEGCWVEVQVRTRLQHQWAEAYERLADRVGRDIRYIDVALEEHAQKLVSELLELSDRVYAAELGAMEVARLDAELADTEFSIRTLPPGSVQDRAMNALDADRGRLGATREQQREIEEGIASELAAIHARLEEL